ncbi:hypothetical protein TIFTF001_002893 [Ficus carica]|uniref:Uncharacterized protein n=1 Tax=Ficus carica TaxID=3494 RepID=A0AA88D936_FICCA|nr:hypothetical protein TIFTF001_002893 [Ficus carica]
MSDTTFPTGSSNPLVSRLDRLDFLMKYLERRTKFEGLENDNITNSSLYGGVVAERNGCVPMDLALKEVQVKGPLVDRVAALESRLFQVKRILQVRYARTWNQVVRHTLHHQELVLKHRGTLFIATDPGENHLAHYQLLTFPIPIPIPIMEMHEYPMSMS